MENFKNDENSILQSVMKNYSKHPDLEIDLNNKLKNISSEVNHLNHENKNLSNNLENEKRKIQDMDRICREELKVQKIKDQETVKNWEKLEEANQEFIYYLKNQEEKKTEQLIDLDKIKHENNMLKNELKRLGELTSEKILDLENNINQIGRMKEFEKDNYDMEKEKIQNSSEFVIEQMKTQFGERSKQIDENMRKVDLEKQKLIAELKNIQDELRSFNINADHKIRNVMNLIVDEESNKQREEVKIIEDKIRAEEHEISSLNKQNQDIIQNFQSVERDFKSRLINSRNLNTRYKEEYTNLEDQNNKLIIRANGENKEISDKATRVLRLENELADIREKASILGQNYHEELDSLDEAHREAVDELNNEFSNAMNEEKRLIEEIKSRNDRIFELQKSHSEMIDNLQSQLNKTLNRVE